MANPRNVPLIECRADARVLEDKIREHKKDCQDCAWSAKGQCGNAQAMRNELKAIREELRTWFESGPDQETLFESEA